MLCKALTKVTCDDDEDSLHGEVSEDEFGSLQVDIQQHPIRAERPHHVQNSEDGHEHSLQ